jgi:RNA polymerase sigma-70 factor (ECF subfamily)
MTELPHETTTIELLTLARQGDRTARDRLIKKLLPSMTRWAGGRLPKRMRDINETQDIVQIALLRTFDTFSDFRMQDSISLRVYLRNTIVNLVRDEMRKYTRRPYEEAFDLMLHDASEADPVCEHDELERHLAYRGALRTLPDRQRTLISMRVEFGMSYDRIAQEMESTPDAVRIMTSRAVVQLAKRLAVNA